MFATAFKHSNKELLPPGPPPMCTCSFQHGENFVGSDEKLSCDEIRRRIGLAPTDNQRSGKTWRDGLITARELQTKQFKPVRIILPELIPEGLTILAGKPKIGKSWLMLDVCVAVAGDRSSPGHSSASTWPSSPGSSGWRRSRRSSGGS